MTSSNDSNGSVSLPLYGILGGLLVLLSELGLFRGIEIIGIYFTPLAWTGYILFADALLWKLQKSSFIRSWPKDFLRMLGWSVICWLVFESFNVYLQNWKYVGLPSGVFAQLLGFVWSFATIFPAVLITASLLEKKIPLTNLRFRFQPSSSHMMILQSLGAVLLALPLLVPQNTAANLFVFVWIGFILLLEPANFMNRRDSIIARLSRGDASRLIALILSGLFCGFLWEFWNYWATSKWLYSIPLSIAGPKLFEMPLLGYLGFLAFAVECYAMNEFFYVLFPCFQNQSRGS